ncbi:MAG TPA: DUF2490 domain-containing protein [Cytophagaceae bacterium]|jgi:hypothetical protein|nr:DUF2490 domain-containing protein [Cytophagaceae bacterium]
MKKSTKIIFIQLMLIAVGYAANAQSTVNLSQHPRVNTHRQSFWSEVNLFGKLSKDKKWQYQIDLQYRRMADADYIKGGQHNNIFAQPYQQVFRPWIHYWAIPGALRFSLSPIGYWLTYTPEDEGALNPTPTTPKGSTGSTVFPEFRTCPQVTLVQSFGRVQVSQRFRYEFRWIGNKHVASHSLDDYTYGYSFYPNDIGQGFGSSHQGRLRWQCRMMVPLTKKNITQNTLYLNAWNELFIAMGKHVGYNKMLNQNRVVGLLGYMLPSKYPIKLELGVTYQTLFYYNIGAVPTDPSSNFGKQNVEYNTAYTVYLIFDDFHSFVKKKDKKVAMPEDK